MGLPRKQKFSDNQIARHLSAIKVMNSADTTLHAEEGIEIPSFEVKHQYDEADLECILENALHHEINKRIYLIIASHTLESRKSLGLPSDCLQPGDRLLMTKKHLPGIHLDHTYISDMEGTYIALHVEDCYLRSANYHHAGAPMLWVIIHPSQKDQLESYIMHSLKISPHCSQFVRHQSILVPPSLLRKWGVRFSICLTKPGDLMLLESGAYHYGKNLGANKKTAINYASHRDWTIPPLYRCCVPKYCPRNLVMPFETWNIDKLRRLDIEDPDEASAKVVLAELAKKSHNTTLASRLKWRPNSSLRRSARKPEKKPEPCDTGGSVTKANNEKDTPPSSINSSEDAQMKAVPSEVDAGTESSAVSRAREHVPGKSLVPALSQRPVPDNANLVLAIDTHKSFGRTSQDSAECELHDMEHEDSIRSLVPVANASSVQLHREPNMTDVAQERDITRSSSLAIRSLFPTPVNEIRWLLRWVESNRHIQLKWPGTCTAIDYEKDLSVLDPCRTVIKDSWLNDTIIFQLLQYFAIKLFADEPRQAVQILDPLNLKNAVKNKNSALLYLQGNIETFIAPLHIGNNHWFLIIVKAKDFEVDFYDSNVEGETRYAAKLITDSIDPTCEWREKVSVASHGQC